MNCDKCNKNITGQYIFNEEKKEEGKKFCSLYCMHQYYGEPCAECSKKSSQWHYSQEKNDGKKFCSNYCMQNYYRKQGQQESEKSTSEFWDKNQNWIIGGGIFLVVLIIIVSIFRNKKK
ncbi:MAG: hypothetical protein mread185_000091 [Mycoplasmataceae bacterium]|nr:MAG: hypothetical protein mread185_000091 [Mycoplasmataceae bacterium]